MGQINFLFLQCKTAFNMNTCHVMSNISQLLPIALIKHCLLPTEPPWASFVYKIVP